MERGSKTGSIGENPMSKQNVLRSPRHFRVFGGASLDMSGRITTGSPAFLELGKENPAGKSRKKWKILGTPLKKIVDFFEVRGWKGGQKRVRSAQTACQTEFFCARHGSFEFSDGPPVGLQRAPRLFWSWVRQNPAGKS